MNANKLLSEKSVASFRHRVEFLTEMIGQMPLSEVGPLRRGFELLDEAKEELLVAGLLRGVSADD